MMVDSIRRLNQRRNRLFENACRRRLPLQTGAAEKHQTFRLRAADLNETGSGSLFERDRTLRRSEPPDFSHGEVQLIALGLAILFTILFSRFDKDEKEAGKKAKKQKETETITTIVENPENGVIYSCVKGKAAPVTESSDAVFASKTMGDGFVFYPEDDMITSPVNGEIMMTFPTKHALGIKAADGSELLLHMGIDTVSLDGEPFELFVKEGDKIQAGQKLAMMNRAKVEQKGFKTETMLVVTNGRNVECTNTNPVAWGAAVGKVQ